MIPVLAITWLPIIINVLLVIFVVVCLLMTLLILMQRPKQEGLGAAFGGGVTDQVFGANTTNALQKGTAWLGFAFFALSLTLAVLVSAKNKQKELGAGDKPAVEETSGAETPPPVDQPSPRSLADELSDSGSEDITTEPDDSATDTPDTPDTPEDKSEDGER